MKEFITQGKLLNMFMGTDEMFYGCCATQERLDKMIAKIEGNPDILSMDFISMLEMAFRASKDSVSIELSTGVAKYLIENAESTKAQLETCIKDGRELFLKAHDVNNYPFDEKKYAEQAMLNLAVLSKDADYVSAAIKNNPKAFVGMCHLTKSSQEIAKMVICNNMEDYAKNYTDESEFGLRGHTGAIYAEWIGQKGWGDLSAELWSLLPSGATSGFDAVESE